MGIDLASFAKQITVGDYIGILGDALPKMNSVDGTIQMRSGKALACALLIMASNPSETLAQSRRTDPDLGSFKTSFLSEPRDEAARPAEVPPGSAPLQNNRAFDGAWTFTSAGCRYTGTLPAKIVDGKIIVKGGSGQVERCIRSVLEMA